VIRVDSNLDPTQNRTRSKVKSCQEPSELRWIQRKDEGGGGGGGGVNTLSLESVKRGVLTIFKVTMTNKSEKLAASIGVHPSSMGLSQDALPGHGGHSILSSPVPAFSTVESTTSTTVGVKLTEDHRGPAGGREDVLLLFLRNAGYVRVLKVMRRPLFTHSRKGP